mgnify:CR=1 FL=1
MTELKKCIVCEGDVKEVMNLGELYPSAFIHSPDETSKFTKSKTSVNWCSKCKNMQASYTKDGEELFRDYYYNSGINAQMRASLLDIVQSRPVQDTYLMNDEHMFHWLDIACNDGTMCGQIKNEYSNSFVVGVDPANVKHKGSDVFINDFFSADKVRDKIGDRKIDRKFDVISCIAMMYDIVDIHKFVEDVKSLLKEDGVFVAQLMDLESRVKTYAIDDCCEEHVVCYSLECLVALFKRHGLEVFDLEYNKTNCSSLRIYVGFEGKHEVRECVEQTVLFQSENFTFDKMTEWWERVQARLWAFKSYLDKQKFMGKKIYLVGASTKANTLLQLAGIDNTIITEALELSDFKFGRYMLWSNIPIVSEKEHFAKEVKHRWDEVYVIAIWAFKDGILKNYQKYRDQGCTMIWPFPVPTVL